MDENNTPCVSEANPPPADPTPQINGDVSIIEAKPDCEIIAGSECAIVDGKAESDKKIDDSPNTLENGIILDVVDECKNSVENLISHEPCEVNDDARSLGDLDSLPAGDELALGAAGSDSGVEGCGRALSSGGGSRSCASSVVSCGSGCGSESSSLAGAPPRPRRRVNVSVAETKRSSPVGSSTPRLVTAPRGPNLATRERARSREKPTLPEKPRPLTPKPRIRPTGDLPNLVRESPALRAKPTKTSTARCRTPNSPSDEKKWPTNGPRLTPVSDASATRVAADKYGTLPRRRRDEQESSPKHEGTPPSSRRPTVARSMSSRSATKVRVRIYAEKISQTVLVGDDIESALAGVMPNIDNRVEVSRCHRGVQVSARDAEMARLTASLAAAQAAVAEERERRTVAEAQAQAERAARLAAIAELERNTQRLLELAGAGAGAGAEGCLRALDEQLRAAGGLAARQQAEIDALREHCNRLHVEACAAREAARVSEARRGEAEREAQEMHEFLAAETGALTDSLREAEAELARAHHDLDKRRAECRQLVRMCEQRRQEALAARAKGGGADGAARALDGLARRLQRLTRAVARAYRLPRDLQPTVYHNDAYSRSDSGEALTPEDEPRGLLASVARALRAAGPGPCPQTPAIGPQAPAIGPQAPAIGPQALDDDPSHLSDDNDNSADLLDSETEPCFVTDPECLEEWWSGAEGGEGGEGAGAWSAESGSPERDWPGEPDGEGEGLEGLEGPEGGSGSASERESLRTLSAAIALRQRSEAARASRGSLLERALRLDARLSDLLHALRLAAAAARDAPGLALAAALREQIDVTEKNAADVVVKKIAEIDASKAMIDQYRQSVETPKKQPAQAAEEDDLECIEREMCARSEPERRALYLALDAAGAALGATPRLAPLRARIERLAFALAALSTA